MQSSLTFITTGKDKDPWWDGEQTKEQAKRHLLEVDAWIAETGGNKAALDIYDNSSGHNCMARDALNSEKLNIGVGCKNKVIIRPGNFVKDGALVQQSMYFKAGDTLYVEVKRGTTINKAGIAGRIVNNHLRGSVLGDDLELIGVLKGVKQVLEERGIRNSTAPGKSGCQQEKVRQKANDECRRLLKDWDDERDNHAKRLLFHTYPKQEDVILQSKLTPCSCASCILSKQDDFRSQKSG